MEQDIAALLTAGIIFEDDDLVVLNKPAGMVVNDAATTSDLTVQSWMRRRLGDQNNQNTQKQSLSEATAIPEVPINEWSALVPDDFDDTYGDPSAIFTERQGMVHRLDKETSGVLILAKNPGALVNLLAQFRLRQVEKEYICLVHGQLTTSEAMIDAPIARASRDRKKFAVVAEGRPAQTWYQVKQTYTGFDEANLLSHMLHLRPSATAEEIKIHHRAVIESLSYQGFSLVTCLPKTGRTHQIRVHFAHLGHPLVGDSTYVGKKRKKLDMWWCRRHFLHAASLKLTHPRTHQHLTFVAPLTLDLHAVQAVLK